MVSVKNNTARLIVLFGVNCIPGQVTDLPNQENNDEFKATVKGVEGLKIVKTTSTKAKKADEVETDIEPETDDELEDGNDSGDASKPAGWNVNL